MEKGEKDVGSNQFLRPIHISFTASAYQKNIKKYLNLNYFYFTFLYVWEFACRRIIFFSPTLNLLLLFPVLFPKGKKKRLVPLTSFLFPNGEEEE